VESREEEVRGGYYLHNLTTGYAIPVQVIQKPSTANSYLGQTAEFIIESQAADLGAWFLDYGTTTMSGAAYDASGFEHTYATDPYLYVYLTNQYGSDFMEYVYMSYGTQTNFVWIQYY
jgi:hypothetical protein